MALTPIIRAFVRVANLLGRGVLEAVVIGQFQTTISDGGLQMITGAVNGKSFSFQVSAGFGVLQIMETAELALEFFDGSSSDQITAMLSTRPVNFTVPTFGGVP